MAKIAYLILAHQHPEQLARLCRQLRPTASRTLVHVDARVDIAPFIEACGGSARFLPNRTAIHWYGFSMVRATLSLLRAAYDAGADRFVLLSGADYVLASDKELVERLGSPGEKVHVTFGVDPTGDGYFDRRANRFYFGDFGLANPRTGRPKAIRIAGLMSRMLWKRRYPVPVFYGPSWWCLTREGARIVLGQNGLVRRFRWASNPDEMFVQTSLKNAPLASSIAFDETAGYSPKARQQALHYVDWENPNPAAPRTLVAGDLEAIRRSGSLFVRKVDPARSEELLRIIDNERAA